MFYSEKEVLKIWEERLKEKNRENIFSLYVDNPFCINQCLYCKHTGSDYKKNVKECRDYYERLLPSQIVSFNFLFKERVPDTIYFGGGTSSIMSAKDMLDIFSIIGSFEKIKKKVFECSPNLLNREKIDLLIKNKFTYVSFGIQSFKKEVLDFNKRQGYENVPLKEHIREFEDAGIRVNCDLMIFIGEDKGKLSEIKRLEEDLIELLERYNPSFITIYPETLFLKEDTKRGVFLSRELRKMILSIAERYNLNHWNWHLSLEEENIEKEMEICYHLATTTPEEILRAKEYDSTGPPNQRESQDVLSFGGFKHHRPYSYHGRDFVYYNMNDNNKEFYYYGKKRENQSEDINIKFD
jgi:hypothetical protein